MAVGSRHERFSSLGNRACLDFAATLRYRLQLPVDLLGGFPDLLEWLRSRALLDERTVRRVITLGTQAPARCQAVFRRALELREATYRIFTAVAAGGRPSGPDIAAVNDILAEGRAHLRLTRQGARGYSLVAVPTGDPLLRLLTPIAQCAADLLAQGDHTLIRKCANPDCGVLFYDTSRTGRRRWCIMAVCGNRTKVERYHRRHGRPIASARPAPHPRPTAARRQA